MDVTKASLAGSGSKPEIWVRLAYSAAVLHSRPAFGVPGNANRLRALSVPGSGDRQAAAATLL